MAERTEYCGRISKELLGHTVTLKGWVQKRRDLGDLIFIDLRDREGIIQVVFNPVFSKEALAIAETVRNEYVLEIKGKVVARNENVINKNIPTGELEVEVEEIKVLNESKTTPFYIEDGVSVSDDKRLEYRYIDLRRPEMTKNFMLRHKMTKSVRNYLDNNEFIDIETPYLTKSTPEGARDYLVPSRVHPGHFYALPQSPELFKQLLMGAGFDRYYQIVRCFRDEDLRGDRQPEFTQIDIETSFLKAEDIQSFTEEMLVKVMKDTKDIDVPRPFPQMSYDEAINRFGSDKPDIRFGLELIQISDLVKDSEFKVFSGAVSNGGEVKETVVSDALGALRTKLGKELELIDKSVFAFLWIVDWPLLEYDEEAKRYTAAHHPFTMPREEDVALLETAPEKVQAQAYDIVLNGYELGGGSIRIHSREVQEKMFAALGFTKEEAYSQFGFLLEALEYGFPPHGGIALGLDRFAMLLAGEDNIREVIAFPKNGRAVDPLTKAPSLVSDAQLVDLSIKTLKTEE